MENILSSNGEKLGKPFTQSSIANLNKILIGVLVVSIVLGTVTGFAMAKKGVGAGIASKLPTQSPKTAVQDTQTFKDFAEGTLKARNAPTKAGEYVEGSHLLVRDGGYPVALTSSVVDLSKYDGKKVKVYGETQKALKEGWLMDVGRIEEIQ